jgi:hypothetical protein
LVYVYKVVINTGANQFERANLGAVTAWPECEVLVNVKSQVRQRFHGFYWQRCGIRPFILQNVKPVLDVEAMAYFNQARVWIALDLCPHMMLSVRECLRTEAQNCDTQSKPQNH